MQPYSHETAFAQRIDHWRCGEAIRQGSRSFHAASLILPPALRESAYGLYAFCRLSDDEIDLGGGSATALMRLRQRLAGVYEGQPEPHPADRAMADIVRRHAIPRVAPEALLEGLAWDTEGRRYESFEDLCAYAVRVAGTVGVMMTLIMGVRDSRALARACDLGVAMQLTNIARDVGEDARAGRVYLPLSWLRGAGIDVERFLADPRPLEALKGVLAQLLKEADRLYARARAGIALLPLACRPAILTAALLYAEIGRQVERQEWDSITRRARVSTSRKLALLARALAAAPLLKHDLEVAPLDAAAFLVDAIGRAPAPKFVPRPRLGEIERQFLCVLDIFERLERVERYGE
ncbi:MAG: phytoene/squalene synthase family protein [Methylocystis sp.]